VFQSTDGIIWLTAAELTNNLPIHGVEFGAGTFVAVGGGGKILQSGNIGGLPSIITQPQDQAAVVGNPVSLTVQAAGAAPLSFQWYSGTTPIANATNTSYIITNTTTAHAGSYSVVVSNSFGSVTSRVAQLTVAFLDIKAYAGITILGVPGKTYRIEATAANGPPNWQTLTNLVLPASPHVWIDYDSPTVGQRLYRAAELP
jgi:hypothetical protein